MSDVVGSRKVDFAFIWKIENFSLIHKPCTSPIFIADTLKKTKWRLYLNYRDEKSRYLQLTECDTKELSTNFFHELSILCDGGLKEKSVVVIKPYLRFGLQIPHDIFGNREILPGDTLTVLCKIWEENSRCLELGFGFARTRIGSERKSFIWTIDSFSSWQEDDNKTISVELCSYRKLFLTIMLYLDNFSDMIIIYVEGNNQEKVDFTIVLGISVLNISNETVYHGVKKTTFPKGENTLGLPVSFEKKVLIAKKDLLLPDDVLSLKCDLVVSKGVIVLNEIERTTYGIDAEIDLASALANTAESPFLGNEALSRSNSLTTDMRHLFEGKYHSDISLRVRNETFPAHKAVLSARSSVFKTMLETNMTEKLTNTIEIDDIEPDTIRRFLSYIYSDTLDSDINWEDASSLYLAAEKYVVLGLKERCSRFLKLNLKIGNVCEIAVLADMLRDEGLQNYVQNFIQDNSWKIINSRLWEQFVQKHSQLAAEILTKLYKNKFRGMIDDDDDDL